MRGENLTEKQKEVYKKRKTKIETVSFKDEIEANRKRIEQETIARLKLQSSTISVPQINQSSLSNTNNLNQAEKIKTINFVTDIEAEKARLTLQSIKLTQFSLSNINNLNQPEKIKTPIINNSTDGHVRATAAKNLLNNLDNQKNKSN